ncbi:MAG: ABC transporter permease [Oscillospiraceae bacterium]|nr:ABC transporter permease [Oscillospiraceae bacterium]
MTALTNILRTRTRSALTVSAIAVGVFAVVLISAAGTTGQAQITRTLEEMGINSILVQHESNFAASNLNDEYIATISRVAGVDKAMPLMASINQVKLIDEYVSSFTWGINADAREIISLEPLHGRLITAGDIAGKSMVAVIDEDIAMATYGRSNIIGKSIRVYLSGAEYEFEIVGIAKSGISTLQSALSGLVPNFVYIPISTMQMLTGRNGYDKIAVMIESGLTSAVPTMAGRADGASTDSVIAAINDTIVQSRGENSGMIVSNLLSQKQGLEQVLATITLVLSLIAGISLLVSGLTVMTTMLVSVGERRREIGIKKSIGAKDADIACEFLGESVLLASFGSVFGAGAALGVTALGCHLTGVQFTPQWSPVLLAVLFAIVLGAVFGVYPAIKAARLEPVAALRAN